MIINSSIVVSALQNKVPDQFDTLTNNSSCQSIADAISNSNLGGDYNVSTTITWYVGATNKVYMSVRTLVTDKNNKTILDQSKVIYDWAGNALDVWYNPTVNFTLNT